MHNRYETNRSVLCLFYIQTFVRLVSMDGEEIFFVAAPTDGVYNFELDVRTSADEFFGHKSGAYEMVGHVILLDAFNCLLESYCR